MDTKLSFEIHIRLIAASASIKLRIMRKALRLFGDPVMVSIRFQSFLLPLFEYRSPVWMSAEASDIGILDSVVSYAV